MCFFCHCSSFLLLFFRGRGLIHSTVEHLVRLLIQYHDPTLCMHADQHRLSLESWILDVVFAV